MKDLKNYILTDEEVDEVLDKFDDELIDSISFYIEHNQSIVEDKCESYKKFIEYESGLIEGAFSFSLNPYWIMEEYDLSEVEFVNLVLNCIVKCEINCARFYEEGDDDYTMCEYGMPICEYIGSQIECFLLDNGLTKDDLNINWEYLGGSVEYSVTIIDINEEYLPFDRIADAFRLQPTEINNKYIYFYENYNDGFEYFEAFDHDKIKDYILQHSHNLKRLEENSRLSKRVKKLKGTDSIMTPVEKIYSIKNTETEVMF